MKIRFTVISVVLLMAALFSSAAFAADSLQETIRAARNGDPAAQFLLGVYHREGRGVRQDHAAAAEWFRRAADQGNADGQVNLGYAYENGQGVPRDERRAAELYRKAAEQGNATARHPDIRRILNSIRLN